MNHFVLLSYWLKTNLWPNYLLPDWFDTCTDFFVCPRIMVNIGVKMALECILAMLGWDNTSGSIIRQ
jgi:hypothetical protein